MSDATRQTASTRVRLTRERVLRAGADLADLAGIETVSMRRLGQELGVEAMSLYHHVANKDDLVDGMVELVLDEINDAVGGIGGPDPREDWQGALRLRVLTSRQHMLRHRWLPAVLEARTRVTAGVAVYFDGVLATLLAAGFSYDLAHHSLHALGSRAMGFAQELFDPGSPDDDETSQATMAALAPQVPHLVGMLAAIAHDDRPEVTLGWCDDQTEFEFGLDVLLDGLERRRLHLTASPD